MNLRTFLNELKTRNVVRVAGVYTVTAWGIGSRRVTYLPGEVVAPDPRLCTNHENGSK